MKLFPMMMVLAVAVSGCAGYRWSPSIPANLRTVEVPTFRNATELTETGSVVTRQLLREFQREGSFKIVSDGAALEIQGEVISASSVSTESNYRIGSRYHGGTMRIVAKVSVIDKVNGRVLVDNLRFAGEAPYSSGMDLTTALRDASGRAADDLAQRIVDKLVSFDFKKAMEK